MSIGIVPQEASLARGQITPVTFNRGIGWGLIGGSVGTLIMDLILMGVLSAVGLPALSCFSMVGDTVARFFSILGIEITGGITAGVATHYIVGPIMGVIFGAAMVRAGALRAGSKKKIVAIAVLYVEIVSQPILAMTPFLLKMTAADTLQWFGSSFVMHLVWGIVLGVIVSHGLQPAKMPHLPAWNAKIRLPPA